jgi:iron complex transport system substrate-binding protein
MKIVSLLPSATEIVASLGATHRLAAVSHCCDGPAEITVLPRATSTAVEAHAAPGAIDRQVREIVGAGQPLYAVDEALVRAIAPGVIVTQAVCEVCAVSEGDVRAIAAGLDPEPAVVTLDGKTLEGVFADIARVGAAIGAADEAEELVLGLRARLRHVHETLKAARAPRPRVAVIEWTDPVFAGGHWVPEMVARAGGTDVLAIKGEHSKVVSLDEVRRAAPEVVFVGPCGYDLAASVATAEAILADPAWAVLRGAQVWALDANGMVSRPGPRLVQGVEAMAAAMHPALFGAPLAAHAVRVA